jgi:hypothetical protein
MSDIKIPIFVAFVDKTGLAPEEQGITFTNTFLGRTGIIASPIFDGAIKLPAPSKGDRVLVFKLDSSNMTYFYVPIRKDLSEVVGKIEMNAEEIDIGTEPTDPAVLGNQLKTLLDNMLTQIEDLTVSTIFGPSGPPINSPAFVSIQATLNTILSLVVKLK